MRGKVIIVTLLISGCSTDSSLYFGTYTRVGIDVSERNAGIGAKNTSIHVTPTKEDGSAFSVLGHTDLDLAYTDVVVRELVAVGPAADCAAMATAPANAQSKTDLKNQDQGESAAGPLIFGSQSSWSLIDASWGDSTGAGINFGYKRSVGIKMPIKNDTVGAAYANVTINSTGTTHAQAPKSNVGGTRNTHTFATGNAAIIKAAEEASALNGGNQKYTGCLAP